MPEFGSCYLRSAAAPLLLASLDDIEIPARELLLRTAALPRRLHCWPAMPTGGEKASDPPIPAAMIAHFISISSRRENSLG